MGDFYIHNCYAVISMILSEYFNMLRRLTREVKELNPKIIGGEFDVWAVEWETRKLMKGEGFYLRCSLV